MDWYDGVSLLGIGLLGAGLIRDMPKDVKLRDRNGLWLWGVYWLTWGGLLYLLGRIIHDV